MAAIPVFGLIAVFSIHEKPINRLHVACFSRIYDVTIIYCSLKVKIINDLKLILNQKLSSLSGMTRS